MNLKFLATAFLIGAIISSAFAQHVPVPPKLKKGIIDLAIQLIDKKPKEMKEGVDYWMPDNKTLVLKSVTQTKDELGSNRMFVIHTLRTNQSWEPAYTIRFDNLGFRSSFRTTKQGNIVHCFRPILFKTQTDIYTETELYSEVFINEKGESTLTTVLEKGLDPKIPSYDEPHY